MAYENATAATISDLFEKLAIFATANGWTKNEGGSPPSDRICFSKNSVFVSFRWAPASPTAVGIYQATAYTSSANPPGGHTNDSGNGFFSATTVTNANILSSRCAYMTNAPMTYWFFENDSSPAYIHVVVTIDGTTSGKFSHFGFGELVKQGTWTGGEYAYGHYYNNSGTAGTSMATSQEFTCLLDGGLSGSATATTIWRPYAATIRMENLPGQAASTRWGLSWADSTPATDRGGNARYNIQGGFRGGPVAAGFGRFLTTPTTGLTAMYPINVYYDRGLVSGVRQWYPLGYMADVRGIDIQNYTEGTELTVGSDIWIPFAANYRQTVTANGATQTTGIAYKKVTT